MSRSLGSIRLDLVAITGKFETGLAKSSAALSKFGSVASKIGNLATRALGGTASALGGIASKILSVQSIVTGAVAAVGVGKLAGAFNQAAEEVDNLGKKAQVLGVSIEDLSVLRFAAGESGVEFETLTKMIGKSAKNLAEFAATGSGPGADAFRRLGIQAQNTDGTLRSMTDVLPEIAVAFEGLGDAGERLRFAEAIFGRGGGEQFVQFLEDSGGFMGNLADQAARAKRLGVVFTDSQFERLKAYNDAVGRIRESWLGIRVAIMEELAPALTHVANKTAEVMGRLAKFAGNFASVIRTAIEKTDIFRTAGEPDLNLAFEALKRFASRFFAMATTEVSTRVRYFFARVWETIRLSLISLFSSGGEMLANGIETTGDFIGSAINAIAKALGSGLSAIASKLGDVGGGIADKWREAGVALTEYGRELEDERGMSRDLFSFSIAEIERLGEKYRGLRGEVNTTGAAIDGASKKIASVQLDEFDRIYNGMRAGFLELQDEVQATEVLGKDLFSTLSRGFASELGTALAKGEASFRNFGKTVTGILGDLAQKAIEMILQFYLLRAVAGIVGPMFPTSNGVGGSLPNFGGAAPVYAAKGGVFGFASGGVASGVLGGPAAFSFSRKVGVAGEAGAEAAFAPLRRIGGELGVKSVGGDVTVQVIDQRSSGQRPEVQSGTGPDGRRFIQILVRDEVRKAIGDGSLDRTFAATYGLGRKGTVR